MLNLWRHVSRVLIVLGSLLLSAEVQAGYCDPLQGKRMFNRCVACHSLDAGVHKMGPSLANLFGRKIGSAEGFLYSLAMEQADFVWNDARLDKFLKDPAGYLPGTAMPFAGLKKSKDRENLICYLKS